MDDECILLGFAQTNNPLESTFLEMNIQARILVQITVISSEGISQNPPLVFSSGEITVAGSRVNLTCCYPCKYYSYEKYWCRWSNTGCAMLPVQQQQGLPQPGDACEPNARTVVLSLDPVTEEDKGWYWCGVKRNGVFGETMAVELQMSEGELRARAPRRKLTSPTPPSWSPPATLPRPALGGTALFWTCPHPRTRPEGRWQRLGLALP
uniref:Ig-like domain-containing protein n=1 Tax=Zonotrichia albicollis TaxID=44394 RepID=A0A8D2ML03_ZONAL